MSTARDEDAAYRRAWGTAGKRPFGRGLRAAYYADLPPSPRGPWVTREDARRYLGEVERVIDRQVWTRSEREKLRVIRKTWLARALGHDARFNALGVQGGVSEQHRPKTGADHLLAIHALLTPAPGTTRPRTTYVADLTWPLGRPNPHRRS